MENELVVYSVDLSHKSIGCLFTIQLFTLPAVPESVSEVRLSRQQKLRLCLRLAAWRLYR